MGKRKLKHGLDKYRVAIALSVQRKKHELAMKMVAERVKTDAEFAKDVIKIIGELQQGDLRSNILEDAKKTIQLEETRKLVEKWEKTELLDGKTIDTKNAIIIESQEQQLIEVPTDGGQPRLDHPTELPDYPRDGKNV